MAPPLRGPGLTTAAKPTLLKEQWLGDGPLPKPCSGIYQW